MACLAISIFVGFAPVLLDLQVEALDGDFQTVTPLQGNLRCDVNGQSRSTDIDINVGKSGTVALGLITFIGPLPKLTETKWDPEVVNLQSDRLNVHVTIKASLLSADKFVITCIGSSDPQLTMVGDIRSECRDSSSRFGSADFKVEARAGNVLQLSGTFSGLVQCFVEGGLSSPPPTSGCKTGTDKNDNLIGTSGNDCIDGKGGNDKISGLAGNDKLNGDDGKDLLSGGNGNDELTGGNGADKFDCGAGMDRITDFNPSEGDIKSTNCEQF